MQIKWNERPGSRAPYEYEAGDRFGGGPPPFGFRVEGGVLIPDWQQQAARNRIVQLRDDGYSLRQISAMLRADGVTVSHATVRRVLGEDRP